jgi:phosphatidylserine/phosphatidylglycerophosphate/cardiolipin synthase-like enzyme
MLSSLLRFFKPATPDLADSKLFNESTFYQALAKDLKNCGSELLIECPFIANRRLQKLLPTLRDLKKRKVRIVVNTRDPQEHDEGYRRDSAYRAIAALQRLGVQVLYTDGHHRKLAIIDRSIMYEGSLNILSQNSSSEIMRRIESVQLAWQMIGFVELDKRF